MSLSNDVSVVTDVNILIIILHKKGTQNES